MNFLHPTLEDKFILTCCALEHNDWHQEVMNSIDEYLSRNILGTELTSNFLLFQISMTVKIITVYKTAKIDKYNEG